MFGFTSENVFKQVEHLMSYVRYPSTSTAANEAYGAAIE